MSGKTSKAKGPCAVTQIRIAELTELENAFEQIGLRVGPRTGTNRRTKDDKEWYVVRRFMPIAIRSGMFTLPISIRKGRQHEADFVIEGAKDAAWVEITEATSPADQRELTAVELSEKPAVLLGEYGGRFKDGASEPGYVWSSDILAAIERKANKCIYSQPCANRHLVVYPNSNASALLFDDEDERRAFALLQRSIRERQAGLVELVSGCLIHVLGKEYVFADVLAKATMHRRQ